MEQYVVSAQNDLMQKNQGTPQLGLELAFLQCIELHRRAQSRQPLVAPVPLVSQLSPRQTPVQTPRTAPSQVMPSVPPSAQNHTTPAAQLQPRPGPVSEVAGEDLSALDEMSLDR